VRKVCLYILVFFIATESTSFDQLLKLPVLFEHFREHQQRDQNVDLLEFLSMHYWGQDLDDNDNDRDMQLPFKKVNINTHQVLFARFTKAPQIIATEQTVLNTFTIYKDQYHPESNLTSPFRPPCA
jgi:hypothetical protein